MTPKEIQYQVETAIRQSLQGQKIENPKVDCKSKWYEFIDEPQLYAFLKDCTSIANTVGLDGLIIIGYNDKERMFPRFTHHSTVQVNNHKNTYKII